jgi:hypothetical protein
MGHQKSAIASSISVSSTTYQTATPFVRDSKARKEVVVTHKHFKIFV